MTNVYRERQDQEQQHDLVYRILEWYEYLEDVHVQLYLGHLPVYRHDLGNRHPRKFQEFHRIRMNYLENLFCQLRECS